jgi:hypothetical protein
MVEKLRADGSFDWTPVRADYDADALTLNAICEKYGITREALQVQARKSRWDEPKRPRSSDDVKLIERLMWSVERVIDHMRSMDLDDSDASRQAAALSRLVGTLDKMIALRERKIKAPEALPSREMVELRQRIGRRLEELGVK